MKKYAETASRMVLNITRKGMMPPMLEYLRQIFMGVVGVGIDFGTHKSTVSLTRGQEVEIINPSLSKKAPEEDLLYTKFYLYSHKRKKFAIYPANSPYIYQNKKDDQNKEDDQKDDQNKEDDNIAYLGWLKPRIGQGWTEEQKEKIKNILGGSHNLSVEGVSAHIFYWLHQKVKSDLGQKKWPEPQTYAISVPASWTYKNRRATIFSAMIAGLNEVTLIDEPVAAALYLWKTNKYGIKNILNNRKEEGNVLVVDFGAGTLDLCLLSIDPKGPSIKIEKTDGLNDFGGRNINRALLDLIVKESSELEYDSAKIDGIPLEELTLFYNGKPINPIHYQDFLEKLELKKIQINERIKKLTTSEKGDSADLNFFSSIQVNGTALSFEISALKFKETIEKEVAKKIKEAFDYFFNIPSELKSLKQVFLVGGASQLFCFNDLVKQEINKIIKGFGGDDLEDGKFFSVDSPRWCVVKGAAYYSMAITKNKIFGISFALQKTIKINIEDMKRSEIVSQDHDIEVGTILPTKRILRIQVKEKVESLKLQIKRRAEIVDEITVENKSSDSINPGEVMIEYKIDRAELFWVISYSSWPATDLSITHKCFPFDDIEVVRHNHHLQID